jgi:hypothetical protein
MPFEVINIRQSDKILKRKRMEQDVLHTLSYLEQCLHGTLYKRELTCQVLGEMGWREGNLQFLEGRRYQYKGYKKQVAIEGNFSAYEYVLEGLFRLQVGFDQGLIETGVLLLTGQRSTKSPLGSSAQLAVSEINMLYPTISMPVTLALFDLGSPWTPEIDINHNHDEVKDGVSVSTHQEEECLRQGDVPPP